MTESITTDFKNELYKIILQANEIQSRELKEDIKNDIKTTIESFSKKIDETVEQNLILQKKCSFLERKIRKNNIIIFGLNPQKENLIANTIKTLNQLLEVNLSKSDINNIYTVGYKNKLPVVIEFLSFLTKTEIFKNVSKLRGTGISITHDLPVEDRKEQKILHFHLKHAREQKLQAKISGKKLIIDNNLFTIEQLQQLEIISENESTEPEQVTEIAAASLELSTDPTHFPQNQQGHTQINIKSAASQNDTISPRTKKRKINYSPKSFQTDGAKGVLTRSTSKKN